ncbi:ABC transporter permease [Deinococcus aquatilis]|uniref:ABC transporter permease n=1 Tax=Deinococcus aquatilis TaxID=519440 RepID=UPI000476BB75|nr:ABC transporter permease [Deinococcus aquatilis]
MLRLFAAEFRRSALLMRRYLGNTVGGIIGITLVFLALFYGAQFISGVNRFGDRLDTLVVGYTLWTLILFVLAEVSSDAQQEAQSGTLEQVCLSPFGLTRIFVLRGLANMLWMLCTNAAVLGLLLLITGVSLQVSAWVIVPVIGALLSAYGLAFLFGSLALSAKKIQQLLNLVNFALLFLLMTPFETMGPVVRAVTSVLPLVPSAEGLRLTLVQGQPLEPLQVMVMLLSGAVWFGLGLLAFRGADRSVRQRGVLNSY